MGPLAGIKVLDLSRILAGPWATQLLADLGAEVIKVERPEGGDDTRHWGPPYLRNRDGCETGESAYFLSTNRGKRSVAIDFSTEDGSRLVRDLALQSDVLIENYKVGGLEKYRLAWKDLAPLHPALIYCSISAFGQVVRRPRVNYDAMIQAMGGLMSVTGIPDERTGRRAQSRCGSC
jgi:crotonobetainyl-CoA:carnitine CoA-transferase CaiB-like acyl-CoA transferase